MRFEDGMIAHSGRYNGDNENHHEGDSELRPETWTE